MKILTKDAGLYCDHGGKVTIEFGQGFVTVEGAPILIEPDPVAKPIKNCPYAGVGVVPCNLTLPVLTGYSDLLRIDGRRVCRKDVMGLTNGSPPPGTFRYTVKDPGQHFVSEAGS